MKPIVFTLKDFMELEQFPNQVLLTPELNPAAVVIQHVSVIETPIERFVRRGELVITTVLGCRDSESSFLEFIRSICESDAAAIAVAFPEDRDDLVPRRVLRYACKQGVPILRLPWEYRFAEITETVVTRLRFNEQQEAAAWETFQKKMLGMYLQHRDLRQAADLIARELGADVLIVDIGGRPIADTRQQQLAPDRPLPEGVMASYRLLLHINTQGQDVGCLYVDAAHATPMLISKVLPFSSYILTPLLLWFDRNDISQSNRLRALDDIIRGLVSGSMQLSEDVLSHARTMGLRLARPYICLVANMELHLLGRNLREWLDDHEQELQQLLKQKGFVPMATIYWDHIVIYAESGVSPSMLVERLQRLVRVTFPELSCVWGISDETGSQEFDRLYREARLAADLCRRESGVTGVYSQKDIVLYRLLSGCLDNASSSRMREKLIRPLLQYDTETGSHLEQVLLCYFQCNGNVCKTAETLHFHRQSLRYRLQKIQNLLDVRFDDHERMLQIELSLRLQRFDTLEPQVEVKKNS